MSSTGLDYFSLTDGTITVGNIYDAVTFEYKNVA